MSRLYSIKDALHRDSALSVVLEKIGDNYYFAVVNIRPSTPTIVTLTTADANWTAVATGLTDVLEWRLSELNGNDFHYAYEAAPGNNFSIGFGWVSEQTSITNIYVKRPATGNITIKLEYWK